MRSQLSTSQWKWKQWLFGEMTVRPYVLSFHKFNKLDANNENSNGKPRLAYNNVHRPPLKKPVVILFGICQSQGKAQANTQSNHHKCISEYLKWAWDIHCLWAQNQRHHTIEYLEERGIERGNAWQSSWNYFKDHHGESFERQGGPCRYYPELNWATYSG